MAKRKNAKKYNVGIGANVILEGLRGDFKVFGEALIGVKEKGDATFEAVGKLQEDMTIVKEDVKILKKDVSVLKEDVSVLKRDVSGLKEDVSGLKSDMVIVKGELGVIRNELKEKVGRDEFNLLEKRVINLENVAKAGKK